MARHEHVWVPAGHVSRCADPDCLAWLPPTLVETAVPVQRPARKRKPPKHTAGPAAVGGEASNVIPFASTRR